MHKPTLRRLLLPGLLCFAAANLNAQKGSSPNDFYIVSMVTSDASPFWYRYILHVAAEGNDSIVRYIRIAPIDLCPGLITVKATTVRLVGTSPAELVADANPCAFDTDQLTRKLQRRIHRVEVDDSVKFGIVANCGTREVVLRLPFPEQVNLKRLRKVAPKLARWWYLNDALEERAFSPAGVFRNDSAEQDAQHLREGSSVVPELRAGRFDRGLEPRCADRLPCVPASFRDELNGYVGPWPTDIVPRLLNAEQYNFKHYVAPQYPALAFQQRISAMVKLELSVDKQTGSVRQITILQAHLLFVDEVKKAVQQWQFAPAQLPDDSNRVHIDLSFDFHCPKVH